MIFRVMDDMAALLGVVFKKIKDVIGVRYMEFIGFGISTTGGRVEISVPEDKVARMLTQLEECKGHAVAAEALESVLGRL